MSNPSLEETQTLDTTGSDNPAVQSNAGSVGQNSTMMVFMIFLIVQAVIGILAIEYALARSARMR